MTKKGRPANLLLALTSGGSRQLHRRHHAVRQGVSNLVDDYVGVRPGDEVFLLYTLDARDPAAWICAEFVARGFEPKVIRMKALQDETLTKRLHERLPDPGTLGSAAIASRPAAPTIIESSPSWWIVSTP